MEQPSNCNIYILRQLIYVLVTVILAKMEETAQRSVTGQLLHAIVRSDILVMIADMYKVMRNFAK